MSKIKMCNLPARLRFLLGLQACMVALAGACAPPSLAAEITLRPSVFSATDTNLDGVGDFGFSGSFLATKGSASETRAFADFFIGDIQLGTNEKVTSAHWLIDVRSVNIMGHGLPGTPPTSIAVRGFVDSTGPHSASDFQMGTILMTADTPLLTIGDVLTFDVTSFLSQAINQHNASMTLGIQALTPGAVEFMFLDGRPYPRLDVTTAIPEPASYVLWLTGLAVLGRRWRRNAIRAAR